MEQIRMRLPGNVVTFDTRHDSHQEILPKKQQKYKQIVECFGERPQMTAKECAVAMYAKGYIPTTERNYTAPRLTELEDIGVVEVIGKKKCSYTGKTVAVYRLKPQEEQMSWM